MWWFGNVRNCVAFKQCEEFSSQPMLDLGDTNALLINNIINSKVEIVSDNIILKIFYFWSTRRLTHTNYLPNLKGISAPFHRKNNGTQEMMRHKNISDNWFHFSSVPKFSNSLNYNTMIFFFENWKTDFNLEKQCVISFEKNTSKISEKNPEFRPRVRRLCQYWTMIW